jgi:hypothetical protein
MSSSSIYVNPIYRLLFLVKLAKEPNLCRHDATLGLIDRSTHT